MLVQKSIGGDYAVVHWDGTSWTESYSSAVKYLTLWANGPNDAWIGGFISPELKHWDGNGLTLPYPWAHLE